MVLKKVPARCVYVVCGIIVGFLLRVKWNGLLHPLSISARLSRCTNGAVLSVNQTMLTSRKLHPAPQDDAIANLSTGDGIKANPDARATPSHCVKTLHIFADYETANATPALQHFISLLEPSEANAHASDVQCISLGFGCDLRLSIGGDISSLKGKDAVVFGMVVPTLQGKILQDILSVGPEGGQTWIYYSTEPPFRVIRMATLDIARLKYHVLMTYHSKSDVHIPFGHYRPFNRTNEGPIDVRFLTEKFYTNRTGMVSWVASSCEGTFWPRSPFVKELQKLLPVDTYGECGTKKCFPKQSSACNRLFASYKFYLVLPNSECHDYITEKFWTISLKHGAVPVVVAAPVEDYAKVAPPNSFVHIGEFKTIADFANHLKRVDSNNDLYREYHDWRNYGEVVANFPLRPSSMCRTLPHIYNRNAEDFKLLGNSSWYQECRELPSFHMKYHKYKDMENWTVWR